MVHDSGRADGRVRDELFRLCKSIARVYNFQVIGCPGEPKEKPGQRSWLNREEDPAMRQMVEELKSSEEKFRTIFENARDMIAFVDLDGKIVENTLL